MLKTNPGNTRLQPFFTVFFLLFTLAVAAFSMLSPIHNWDLIAYVGSARNMQTDDKQEIHAFAYTNLKDYVDEATYTELTSGSDYRSTLAQDPESFWQVLPWYKIRPIYIGGMQFLHSVFGVSLFTAGHLLAAIFTFAAFWVLYFAYKNRIHAALWFCVPFFILLNGNLEVSRLGTPDAMAFLFTAVIYLLFLRSSRHLYWLLPLGILVRTDLIFLIALLQGYLFLVEKEHRLRAVLSLAATVAVYLLLNRLAGNYGWATVFYLVMVSDFQLNYPADANIHVSLMDYLRGLAKGLPKLLIDDGFDSFLALFLLQLAWLSRKMRPDQILDLVFSNRVFALTLLSAAYVLLHFLVFPTGYSRFFAAQYLTMLLSLLVLISTTSAVQDQRHTILSL